MPGNNDPQSGIEFVHKQLLLSVKWDDNSWRDITTNEIMSTHKWCSGNPQIYNRIALFDAVGKM